MKSVTRIAFAFFVAFLGSAFGQTQDCRVPFTFNNGTGITPSANIDNRQAGCDNWVLQYQSTSVNPITLTIESAAGPITPGAFAAFGGTVISGANPAVNIVGSETRMTGYAGWMRVNPAGSTPAGTWTITGVLYGYRSGYFSSSAATCGNPCQENLIQVGGTAVDVNSGNKSAGTQRIVLATDQPALTTPLPMNQTQVNGVAVDGNTGNSSNGTQRVVLATDQPTNTNSFNVQGKDALGAAPTVNPLPVFRNQNGTAFEPSVCSASLGFTAAAAATTRIFGNSTGTALRRICGWWASAAGASTFVFVAGTGTNCATGLHQISGLINAAANQFFSYPGNLELSMVTLAGEDICITTTGAGAVTGVATVGAI